MQGNAIKDALHKAFFDLETRLADSKGQEGFIQSVMSEDLLVFDIRQSAKEIRDWKSMDQRLQLETLFYAAPDYLLRDRIYMPPSYLNVHLRGYRLNGYEFKKRLEWIRKDPLPSIIKIGEIQDFRFLRHDLINGVTGWAHEQMDRGELDIPFLCPGERVMYNIPIELCDESYSFIKLMNDDVHGEYLAFTSETCDLHLHLCAMELLLDAFIRADVGA